MPSTKCCCSIYHVVLKLVPATGKAGGGDWVKRVLPRLGPLPQPGVFMQGLCVMGTDGTMIFTRQLERDVIETVVEFGKKHSKPLPGSYPPAHKSQTNGFESSDSR